VEVAVLLRLLWRRRLRVVVGLAVSVLIGLAMAKHAPAIASANTRVLVDTPRSALAANSTSGMDTLYWRATLLGMLLRAEPARHQIASDMHLAEDQINIQDLELDNPANPASLPVAATQAAASGSESYTLDVYTDDVLPLINITAITPDVASATRLARAAVQALGVGASATGSKTVQPLTIEQAAPIGVRVKAATAGHTKTAITALFVFVLWCVFAILLPASRRHGAPPPPRRRRLRWVTRAAS
jgi:hypothetical protein